MNERDTDRIANTGLDASAIVVYSDTNARVGHIKRSLFDLEPAQQVAKATEIANALVDVIEKQKLYTVIQGKKYVRVEGWELLGTFLGVLPCERQIVCLEDGSYEATVDLIRASDGVTVGGASALCGMDEKRWQTADKYARRSMAFTRAVGKAYRSSFSWIISIAGYEATPAEEMPAEVFKSSSPQQNDRATVAATSSGPQKGKPYEANKEQRENLMSRLMSDHSIPIDKYDDIEKAMMGKFSKELPTVIKEITKNV